MRLIQSIAMLAIATGVAGTIAGVHAASPPADPQIAESKGITAKGGVVRKDTDAKTGSKPNSVQQQIQPENQRIKSGAPK